MQPNSFIIANRLRLFCRTVRMVAQRIHEFEESQLNSDYTGLPIDIKANPFNKEVEKYERSKNYKNKPADFKLKYKNAVLSQYMYRQIVLNGASATFKNYDCEEDAAYDSALTDEVLYGSYKQMLWDEKRKPHDSLSKSPILKQEDELEKFPERHRLACEWINMYFYPITKKEKQIVENMRSNIRFIDDYFGHHNQTATKNINTTGHKKVNYVYVSGDELLKKKLSVAVPA